ncbi:hypothetical protein, partial [Streptomyces sp. Agncl-13]|uniref:hypothetical protein n=1 Tax=Streptomyces sp. Agncl-13 TaxID=3400628 RepID=UPI003A86785F
MLPSAGGAAEAGGGNDDLGEMSSWYVFSALAVLKTEARRANQSPERFVLLTISVTRAAAFGESQ